MGANKKTFNNLITHLILPRIILPDIVDFYNQALVNPDRIKLFLTKLTEKYTLKTQNDPDIESVFAPDQPFDITFFGEMEQGVICIKIPNCAKHLDCIAIGFPSVLEKAGYFTCEYSNSPLINRDFFVVGGWEIEDGEYVHQNYGELKDETLEAFAKAVYDIVYQ